VVLGCDAGLQLAWLCAPVWPLPLGRCRDCPLSNDGFAVIGLFFLLVMPCVAYCVPNATTAAPVWVSNSVLRRRRSCVVVAAPMHSNLTALKTMPALVVRDTLANWTAGARKPRLPTGNSAYDEAVASLFTQRPNGTL
jgi:hypothetical protein